MAEKRVIEVAAAFIAEGDRVLLARRKRGDELGELWEFPGGEVEEDEDLRECLARELREELGVEAAVGEELACVIHDYGKIVVRLHLLRAKVVKGEVRPLDCEEVRWFGFSELASLPLAPADRELLGELVAQGIIPHKEK